MLLEAEGLGKSLWGMVLGRVLLTNAFLCAHQMPSGMVHPSHFTNTSMTSFTCMSQKVNMYVLRSTPGMK